MIWLIGNKGMLGTEISLLLKKHDCVFMGTDREIDITDVKALAEYAQNAGKDQKIKWIINCAAYTAVDKAEDDKETCRRLNQLGAANISECANRIKAKLIHVSTDYVFDGQGNAGSGEQPRPYREDDGTNPTGVYGQTKLDGEMDVMKNNPDSFIIRTAWLYGKHGGNFVHTMLRLMNERNEISVVNDQRGSPTWAFDLACVILKIIKNSDNGKEIPCGIYHFSDEGNISWFDFAKEIYIEGRMAGIIKKDCHIVQCSSAEYPARVKRPAYSVLDKSKIKAALQIDIPSWEKSLKEYIKTCAF